MAFTNKLKESKKEILKKIVQNFEASEYPELVDIFSPMPYFISQLIDGLMSNEKPRLYRFFKREDFRPSFKIILTGFKIIRSVFLQICQDNLPHNELKDTYDKIITSFDDIEIKFISDIEEYFKYASNDILMEKVMKAHKMALIGKLTGYMAYELNNILTVTKNWAHMGLSDKDEAVRAKAFSGILGSSERGAKLTRNILSFSKKMKLEPSSININDFIEEMLLIIEKKLIKEGITIEKCYGPIPEIVTDKFKLREALFNILLNACSSLTGPMKKIIVTTNVKDNNVEIIFSDTGEGIETENQEKIYEPFFSTKILENKEIEWGTGLGMGIPIANSIIKKQGGQVNINSQQGKGTDFKVYLPITDIKRET